MDVEIIFDSAAYTITCIKKAAYRNIHRFSIDIEDLGGRIKCKLHFKDTATRQQIDFYVDEFRKDILDQDLREQIKAETEGVRNLILAHTFSKTILIKDE